MRPIDADALLNEANADGAYGYVSAEQIVNAPTIDTKPVKHGRWVQVICYEEFDDGFVDRLYECCSVCHEANGRNTSNYCPNCGALMDLEE